MITVNIFYRKIKTRFRNNFFIFYLKACNNKNCGFDLGDCGLNNFKDIYRIDINESADKEVLFDLPTETTLFYMNLTNLFSNQNESKIFKAEYEENDLIRKISIINKFRIMTVILMPSAYSTNVTEKNEPLKILIQINNPNDEMKVYKLKILIRLNSFIKKDINEATREDLPGKKLNKFSIKNSSIQFSLLNLSPRVSKISILMEDNDLKSLEPDNVKFSNRIFKNVYKSYYNFLNWSFSQEFISHDGFYYKLKRFHTELSTNINVTYNDMVEHLEGQELENNIMNKFFSNTNGSRSILTELDKYTLLDEYIKSLPNNSNEDDVIPRFMKRKLLDTFADSLRYVNRLFNQIYGYMARKVPAHMPHFIDREIMGKLQDKFQIEFDKTSSNRLRSSTDMQYAFSYYYYVISELETFDPSLIFDEIDLNMNNYLEETELIILSLKLSNLPFSPNKFSQHEISATDMYKINNDMKSLLIDCIDNGTDSSKNQSDSGEKSG